MRLDPATAADALARIISDAGGTVTRGADPITLMKAVKNAAEIAGTRAAHARDGAAVANFLAWFDREAPSGKLTEIDAVAALETFRRETGLLKELSFPTISGAGPNGAIVHYRVTRATNRTISAGELFLLDSGAQYEDGTTDITRTIAVGTPTRRDARPLHPRAQGPHRDRARGVSRTAPPARSSIRSRASLSGPPASTSITAPATASAATSRCTRARRASPSSARTPLKRGMILSNEPGYYKTGAYGIRIENLVLVIEADDRGRREADERVRDADASRRSTAALIEPALMTADEIAWLDAYHARVARDADRRWSTSDTRDVARGRHQAAPWLSRPSTARRNATRRADIPGACWRC